MQVPAQALARSTAPALLAVLVHAGAIAAFLSVRPALRNDAPVASVHTAFVPVPPRPAAAAFALPIIITPMAPRVLLPPPPAVPPSAAALTPAPLFDPYIACGVETARTPHGAAHCDELRRGLLAAPRAPQPPAPHDLQLARRFARDKAAQDAPVLLPCFTPAGPNLLCFIGGALNGFDFKPGSYAARPPESPLAQPVHPYRPR